MLRVPLDPRILGKAVVGYEGETLSVSQCDVPVYHGQGRAEFRAGFVYTGAFELGRMHGRGRIEWANGVVYEGAFVYNEMLGLGKYTWPDGSSYEGQVVRGKRHGDGVFLSAAAGQTMPSPSEEPMADMSMAAPLPPSLSLPTAIGNARYEGQWADGLPHGHGVLVYDDAMNVRYEGAFGRGRRHGYGEMRYASGNLYAGDWVDDIKCGQGRMLWMAGDARTVADKYVGAWHRDRPHGVGCYVWLQTRQHEKNWYQGDFVDGQREGHGTFFYANGARYEGEWKANRKHGRGVFFYEDGRVLAARFQDDRAVDDGRNADADLSAAHGGGGGGDAASARALLLHVDDLLPSESTARDKHRKALAHAALRLNSDLRALYRQALSPSSNGPASNATRASLTAAPSDDDQEDARTLLEIDAFRRLLKQRGVFVTARELQELLAATRLAQRRNAGLPDTNPADPDDPDELVMAALPEVTPAARLVLFREFVEVLVRLAHWRQQREYDGAREDDSDHVHGHAQAMLATIFAALAQQVLHAPLAISQPVDVGGIVIDADQLQRVLHKHRAGLQRLHRESGQSVRALLALLRTRNVLTESFRATDALLAVQHAVFMVSDTSGIDPFLLDMPLEPTEFADALTATLRAKAKAEVTLRKSTEREQSPAQGQGGVVPVPLIALVDGFLQAACA